MPKPSLDEYNRKRALRESDEPQDQPAWGPSRGRFRQFSLHENDVEGKGKFDIFRFEHDGVLKTFVFPKGFSFVDRSNRLAVQLEDHPVEYLDWHGTIKRADGLRDLVRLRLRGELELLTENPGKKLVVRIFGAGIREGTFTFSRNFRCKRRAEWFVSRRGIKPACIDPVAQERKRRAQSEARFHYCAYWGTWSRVLSANHPHGPYVEVNLTPVATFRDWQSEVAPIRIRAHGTQRGPEDKDTHQLPPVIRAQMMRALGPELVDRLLGEDFLRQIDWRKYRKHNNGGANLEDIRK
jgi:hypothetical protein